MDSSRVFFFLSINVFLAKRVLTKRVLAKRVLTKWVLTKRVLACWSTSMDGFLAALSLGKTFCH